MSNKEIACYLCHREATIDNYDRIHCEHCTWYKVSTGAVMYYFDKTGDDQILDDEDKKKLSDYVRDNYDPKKGIPITITTDLIKKVTGKESVHYRYR